MPSTNIITSTLMSIILTSPATEALSSTDFFYSDLCTVDSKNWTICRNDYISREGTCWEDSCCTSFETSTSLHYRIAQGSHVIFSGLGLAVILIYLMGYSSKHMLPDNVRALINVTLFLMFAHSIDMILVHIYHIYQSFKAVSSDPCSVRVKVSFCAPFRYTFSFCTLGLAFCQYCVYIDRLLCAFYRKYFTHQKYIRYRLILGWAIVTTGTVVFVYRNDDSESYLLSCLNIPLDSIVDLSFVTAAVFPINIFCCFLSFKMFRHFKQKENRSRFEINKHFTAAVDVEASEFLFIVTVSQAVFIVIYPVLSLTMRYFYDVTPRPIHLTCATLSYVFSIYCFVIPLVMVNYGRRRSGNRRAKTLSHVKLKSVGKEGADNYFGMIKSQWE